MELMEVGVLVLVFVASSALVFWLGHLVGSPLTGKRVKRLTATDAATATARTESWVERLARSTKTLARLSADESGDNSALRRRLFSAGLRSPLAPTAYLGAKTLLAIVLPLLTLAAMSVNAVTLEGNAQWLALLSVAALGYYLPNFVLSRIVAGRQREILNSFPDALDLLTICMEAGIGIEAALQRVGEDIGHRSRVLGEELQLVGLELRAGAPRERAMHNLALRTGVSDVETFVSMVNQAERFGTSIAQGLRIHGETLRTRRQQLAEERAAQVALQLMFPLVLCILPALLVVVIGPAALRIVKQLPVLFGG